MGFAMEIKMRTDPNKETALQPSRLKSCVLTLAGGFRPPDPPISRPPASPNIGQKTCQKTAQENVKKMTSFSPDLAQGLVKILAKCLVKIWVKFLVKILVKQDNRKNSGDGNNKVARALRARAPLVLQ